MARRWEGLEGGLREEVGVSFKKNEEEYFLWVTLSPPPLACSYPMCSCQIADPSMTCLPHVLDLETITESSGQRARMGVDREQKARAGLEWVGPFGRKGEACRAVTLALGQILPVGPLCRRQVSLCEV